MWLLQGTSRGGADIKEIVKRIDMWAIDMVFVGGRQRRQCWRAGPCTHMPRFTYDVSPREWRCVGCGHPLHRFRTAAGPSVGSVLWHASAVCSAGTAFPQSLRWRMKVNPDLACRASSRSSQHARVSNDFRSAVFTECCVRTRQSRRKCERSGVICSVVGVPKSIDNDILLARTHCQCISTSMDTQNLHEESPSYLPVST